MISNDTVARLDQEHDLSLTTFRGNGDPVSTAVWAAADQGWLSIYTLERTGKVKRLRHSARVTLAPCDRVGEATGEAVEATARLLPATDLTMVRRVSTGKYGWRV